MKISYNWLKQYISTDLPPEQVSDILTNIGLEVEAVESFQSVKGGLEGVVIGQVLTCSKHPDADKLTVTTVDLGREEPVQIVCGALNVAAGQKVPVATVGTTLYPNEEGFTIKKTKIRGELSQGMICAEDELGLGSSHDGIMVLDQDTPVGIPAAEYFNVENDTVFEIGLTPNRIDGASHLGVARDLAAYLKQEGEVTLSKPSVDGFKTDNNDLPISIDIEEEQTERVKLHVTARDTGIGIPEDRLKDMLGSTEMISTAGTDKERGTGLGLRLCHELVLVNKGEFKIESREGEGTTIFVSIPAIPPEA